MFPGMLSFELVAENNCLVALFATPEFDGGSFTAISRRSDWAIFSPGEIRSTSIY